MKDNRKDSDCPSSALNQSMGIISKYFNRYDQSLALELNIRETLP
jgi:hypothetical protein